MKKVEFQTTVFGVPHVGGTDFTAEKGYRGLITDEAFKALRDRCSFNNDPWIIDLGVVTDGVDASLDRFASDARRRDREVVLYASRGL